ncbi:hypothetical protein FACS1894217_03050 [Clostridia bacterium]|nr:hypothetical protein FACS1894217_03050 [Clostridia bacterium]
MKNDRYIQALNGVNPDENARKSMWDKACEKSAKASRRAIRWLAPVAACLVVAAAIAILQNAIKYDDIPSGVFENIEDISGLPAGDYTWDEGDVGYLAMRIGCLKPSGFFYNFEDKTVDTAIAIVRVKAVKPFVEYGAIGNSGEGQVADCEVIYGDIIENSRKLPPNPQIKQYLYGGCTGDDQTNLLRVGGVYLLDLRQYESQYWHIWSDLDVLMEVDDQGLLHSHSRHTDFIQYNGKELAVLWDELVRLEENLSRDVNTIVGLPAGDFTWEDDPAVNRLPIEGLWGFIPKRYGDIRAAVAIVTVQSVESFSDEQGEGQIATIGFWWELVGSDAIHPQLKIKQYLFGGCVNDEQTNLLRKDGTYVLPLVKRDADEYWHVHGELDVLFEVDDQNLIHSHASYARLREYDGKPLATLWDDLIYLKEHPILPK